MVNGGRELVRGMPERAGRVDVDRRSYHVRNPGERDILYVQHAAPIGEERRVARHEISGHASYRLRCRRNRAA